MTFVRNRNDRTIDIFLPKFIQEMTIKYPLLPNAEYPSTLMASSRYLTIANRKDKEILLSIEQISKMREIIGDLLWIAMHTKPTIKYALNVYSRRISPNPTQFDYNQLLRIMHYCIGTKDEPRRIGGKHGVSLQATVDSSFPSTDDMKGQSAYSIHVSGGGAVIFDTHKHTATAGSSAESEIYGNSYADKSIKWARNFCLELGYNQASIFPNGTPLGQDNLSTMAILKSPHVTKKTRHVDLKTKVLYESRANKIIEDFHLPAIDQASDIGTKPTEPSVFQKLSQYIQGIIPIPQFLKYFSFST